MEGFFWTELWGGAGGELVGGGSQTFMEISKILRADHLLELGVKGGIPRGRNPMTPDEPGDSTPVMLCKGLG